MGKIFSIARNPLRNFNVENRAHKVISKDKPIPAPKHVKDEMDYERLMKEYPEAYEQSLKKDERLDQHLKNVFVTSKDSQVDPKKESDPNRPLPLDRSQVEQFAYGVKEPKRIPVGKVTLRKALEFITNHQNEPTKYTVKQISDDYLLPEEKVKNILKYFRVFEVYVPKDQKTNASFAGPSVSRIEIKRQPRKELPPPEPDPKDKT